MTILNHRKGRLIKRNWRQVLAPKWVIFWRFSSGRCRPGRSIRFSDFTVTGGV